MESYAAALIRWTCFVQRTREGFGVLLKA